MTDPRNGGPWWEPPSVPAGQWPPATPAPAPAPPTHRFAEEGSVPAWATTPQATPFQPPPQPPAQPFAQHQAPYQPTYQDETNRHPQYPPQPAYEPMAAPPAGNWPDQAGQRGHGRARGKNKKVLYGVVAVVVAALVGGGLFFFLSGETITYAGRDIVEPETAISEAESTLNEIVDERQGATNDQTSCYFVAKNADTTDIEDRVVCGPVLFVDGDESEPYLTFPLTVSSGDGDARLTVADEPESPDPNALADPDLLRRPDGAAPPDGNAGLAVPAPPRAEEGVFTEVPSESIELAGTSPVSRIGSPTISIDLPRIGEPERYGRGDDARRPAEGEKFIGFEIVAGPGETGPVGEFSIGVQVGDDDPIRLPDDVELSSDPVQMVIAVREDADEVTLVVTEGTLVQKLSLTTGEPDPGNVAVWQRTNRTQQIGLSQAITIRASQPGFVTEDFASTLTVNGVVLTYFAGPNVDKPASAPSRALLVLDARLTIDGQTVGLEPPYWNLTLPDGTIVPAVDLHDDPTLISIGFEVPADFTEGTLNFGGVLTAPDGLTLDTLGVFIPIPIAVPEG